MNARIAGLARGTLVYGIGEVASRLVTLFLLPVFTAYLSPSDYGVISILTALGLFLTPVFSVGLGAAIAPIYFEGNRRERKHTTIATASSILIVTVAVLVIAGTASASAMSVVFFRRNDFAALVIISIGTTAFSILAIPFRQYLQFEERSAAYVILSAVSILTTTVLSVVMVVWLNRGVRGMLEASLAGQFVGFIVFLVPAARDIAPKFSRPLGRELLTISLPLVPAFGCLYLLQHGSKYLLQWLGTLDEVGIYTVGLNVGLVISLIVTAFQNAWIPYFMSFADRPAEARVVFGRVLTYYVIVVGTLTMGVFAVARPLILLMTKPPFHPAWTVVGLAATAQFLAGVYAVMLPGMYIAKDVHYSGALQGVAAVFAIVANVLLIPPFGIKGASIALVASYAVLVVAQYAWNRWRRYPPVDYDVKRLVLCGVAFTGYASLTLIPRQLPLPRELMVTAALVLLLACLPMWLLEAGERQTLASWLARLFDRSNRLAVSAVQE